MFFVLRNSIAKGQLGQLINRNEDDAGSSQTSDCSNHNESNDRTRRLVNRMFASIGFFGTTGSLLLTGRSVGGDFPYSIAAEEFPPTARRESTIRRVLITARASTVTCRRLKSTSIICR